jgi:alkanesulfonate monooxygenase SsuD/methylene tetrahydromethanopterin reductase-like flavin-dependent oxidoreductase (luciferase family)
VDIGIGLPNAVLGAEGSVFVPWARRAEERGFSSLATIGRVAYPTYEEITTLAAAAAVTSRIGLLTDILIAPTRNFVLLAKEAATLDQLSGGRFTLGLAAGGRADDFAASDQDMSTRGRRFDEGLELMHRAWRGDKVAGAGDAVSPRPVRSDRVQILFGGDPAVAAPRATRWGVGWTVGGRPPESVSEPAEMIREAWTAAGREGSPRIVALTYFSLGEGIDDLSRESLRHYYNFIPDMVEGIAEGAARSPDAVRARAQAFEDASIDELIFDPSVARLDQVDLLADALF